MKATFTFLLSVFAVGFLCYLEPVHAAISDENNTSDIINEIVNNTNISDDDANEVSYVDFQETGLLKAFKDNLDADVYAEFKTALDEYVQENELEQLTNQEAAQFILSYMLNHLDFYAKAKEALSKAITEHLKGSLSEEELTKLLDALENGDPYANDEIIKQLKKEIDELKNLNQEEKDAAKKAVDQILKQNEDLMKQLTDSNTALKNLGNKIADALKPKGLDPMVAMLIALVLMLLLGGGSSSGSSSCCSQ